MSDITSIHQHPELQAAQEKLDALTERHHAASERLEKLRREYTNRRNTELMAERLFDDPDAFEKDADVRMLRDEMAEAIDRMEALATARGMASAQLMAVRQRLSRELAREHQEAAAKLRARSVAAAKGLQTALEAENELRRELTRAGGEALILPPMPGALQNFLRHFVDRG